MARYNIEHKGKYYVFSTICDGIVEEFNSFEELQKYRLEQYGKSAYENEELFKELKANKMQFKDIILPQIRGNNESNDNIIEAFSLLEKDEMLEVFKEFLIYHKERMEE